MKTRLAALLFSMLVAGLAGACSSSAPASPSAPPVPETLAGTAWKAVSVAGRSTVVGREPTLSFDAAKVTGSGGCNQFGGDYSFSNGTISFGEMPMTLMGCEEPIGSIETDFLKVLTAGGAVTIDDGGQLLIDGPGGQALLVPAAP